MSSGSNWIGIVIVILGILNTIVLPVIYAMWRYMLNNKKEIEEHKLYVAREYFSKTDTKERFDKIDRNLDKIWKKLDMRK